MIGAAQKAGFFWANYETGERLALAYITGNQLPVVEFGSSVGAMARVIHWYFGKPQRHEVEINPNLIPVLTRNRDLSLYKKFCDVDGAEVVLFDDESDVLAHRVRHLSREFHPGLTGTDVVQRLLNQLADLGFTQLYSRKDIYLFCNDRLV